MWSLAAAAIAATPITTTTATASIPEVVARATTPAARLRAWEGLARDRDRNRVPPTWYGPSYGADAEFLHTEDRAAWLFDDGDVVFVDLSDGRARQRTTVGLAEPRLWSLPGRRLLITEEDVTAFGTDGAVRYRLELSSPLDPLAVGPDSFYVATDEEVRCVSADDGRIRWQTELIEGAIGGPLLIRGRLIIPSRRLLQVVRATDGRVVRRIRLPEPPTAPIIEGPNHEVWVFSGVERARVFDPVAGIQVGRVDDAPSRFMDALSIGSRRVLTVRTSSGLELWQLASPDRLSPWVRDATEPLLVLPNYRGFVIGRPSVAEFRQVTGEVAVRTRLQSRPLLAAGSTEWVALAGARAVWILDGRSGALRLTVLLPRAPNALMLTEVGGMAILEDGLSVGLPVPRDPRLEALDDAIWRGRLKALAELGRDRQRCAVLAERCCAARRRAPLACSGIEACPNACSR